MQNEYKADLIKHCSIMVLHTHCLDDRPVCVFVKQTERTELKRE